MQSKSTISLIIALLACVLSSSSQDVAFSQFYASPVNLNPALAGIKLCPRLTLNYRNQWPEINSGYVTYSATYDSYVESVSGGVSLLANSSEAGGGIYNTFNAAGVYSYRLQASRYIVLNAAIKAGYTQNRINWEKLVFGDQIDVTNGTLNQSAESRPNRYRRGSADLGAGILAGYRESVYFGVAVDHLNKPAVSIFDANSGCLPMRLTIHAGALIDFFQGMQGEDIRNFSISPNVVYMQQGKFHQLNLGMSVNMFPFVGGLWFRNNFETPDAVIVSLGFQQKQYKFGYSFDYTISRLHTHTGGAHEISIAWLFNKTSKKFHTRELKCPSF